MTGRQGNRGAALRWPPLGPLLMALGVIAVLVYVISEALGFTIFRVRLNPLLFASLSLVVALIIFADQLRKLKRARSLLATGQDPDQAARDAGIEGGYFERGEVEGLIWFAVLVAMFVLLGFLVGMTLFIILFLRIYGSETWVMTLGMAIGTMTALFFLFIDFLGVRIYAGMLDIPIPFIN